MVDQAKRNLAEFLATGVPAWGAFLLTIGVGIAAWAIATSNNAHDLGMLQSKVGQQQVQIDGMSQRLTDLALVQSQMKDMASQLGRIADRVEQGPRADQLQEIIRHLSAEDGRLDGYDSRLRIVEERISEFGARMDGMEAASRASGPQRGR